MNEILQGENCIIIDTPNPLHILTVKDEELIDAFSKSGSDDYKRLWADIASNKLTGNNGEKLSSDTIYNSSDDLLVPYIHELLKNNEKLSQKYELHSDEADIYKRLVIARNDYLKELFLEIPKTTESLIAQLNKTFQELQKSALQSINLFSSTFSDNITTLLNSCTSYSFDTTSSDEAEQYIKAYKQWGYYGWTAFPFMPIQYFQTFPESKEFADKNMIPLCNKENIFNLVERIKEYEILNECDLDEALFCFKKKYYKPCAYMLLSFIERLLILSARKLDSNSQAFSNNAAKIIRKSINDEYHNQYAPELLCFFNTLSCLTSVYESSNGFLIEPDNVNRHFMMHGMSNRKISYLDCAKLFLLVHNLIFLFNYLSPSKKEV